MKTVDDLPPTVSGDRPLIGHSLQFMRDPAAVIERGHREHGNAFTLNVGFRPMVVLAGPEHARTVFEQTDEGLSISGGMAFLGSQLGEDFYFLAPADEYRRQREVVLPRFQSRQLDGYLEVMDAEAAEFVRQLGSRGEFDLARKTDRRARSSRSRLGRVRSRHQADLRAPIPQKNRRHGQPAAAIQPHPETRAYRGTAPRTG